MRIFLILLTLILALLGCSSNEIDNAESPSNPTEKTNEEKAEANPDYHNMFIEDIKENSIVIAPHATDPEASYPVYEIFFNQNTKIEGNKQKFDELSINDDLKVWTKKIDDDKKIAVKIYVYK
ncbi:hypothetical protein [Saliterribacillus persicus]|uniref:Lipoprotein n=1 Tax=Saliterribacillus persicus TaxID=930114 RepID=A0A368YB84_9BACI|nr:hypothetical protein [Saliterribacillus persicus]RCW76959.1 hypothetical protein DFR57_102234 [Saliterribacillus persicus]